MATHCPLAGNRLESFVERRSVVLGVLPLIQQLDLSLHDRLIRLNYPHTPYLVKQQIHDRGGALHFVNAPYKIGDRTANPQGDRATFALVSNGAYSMFVKLERSQYGFSEDFSLNRRQNELYNVLRILNRLKMLL